MQNTGAPFFHPVTHTLIATRAFYQGAAHLDHEDVEPSDTEGNSQPPGDSGTASAMTKAQKAAAQKEAAAAKDTGANK